MKILRILTNNKKKSFCLQTRKGPYEYTFSRLKVKPSSADPVVRVYPDHDLGDEGFTYALKSGREDTIHIDSVLEYNRDPDYLCELLLHELTVQAIEAIESSKISKREIARKLKTSPRQLYRLLDPAFYGKTINQMVRLLHAAGRSVEVKIKPCA